MRLSFALLIVGCRGVYETDTDPIDVLVDADGDELEMPTDYDDFTEKAHRNYAASSTAAKRNSKLLQDAMEAEGFTGLSTEWWHFDGPGWRQYELSDEPLTQ